MHMRQHDDYGFHRRTDAPLRISLNRDIITTLENIISSQPNSEISSSGPSTKNLQPIPIPQHQQLEKVYIWEDYSNSSSFSNPSSMLPPSSSTTHSHPSPDKKCKGKRARNPEETSEENGRLSKRPCPTKLEQLTPQQVVYDSKWFHEMFLQLRLTVEDFQNVAVQYISHLLTQQKSQQVERQENVQQVVPSNESAGTTEPIHSLFEDKPVENSNVAENVGCKTHEQSTDTLSLEEDAEVAYDPSLDTTPSSSVDNFLSRRGSLSENAIASLLSQRRGSFQFFFGDGFDSSDSRRNSIDFAANLLVSK